MENKELKERFIDKKTGIEYARQWDYYIPNLLLSKQYKEKDLEDQLVKRITQFLLELGAGFAFIGRQYHLEVGGWLLYRFTFLPLEIKIICCYRIKNRRW